MDNDRTTNNWRFSKDIPITVVGFLILQAVLLIVSYVDLVSTVKTLVVARAVSEATAYTKDDARKDRELADTKLLVLQTKNDELVRRIGVLEGQANELLGRARAVR